MPKIQKIAQSGHTVDMSKRFYNKEASARTNSLVKLHANDRVLVALVRSRIVAELNDPASGGAIGRASVHQPVGYYEADDCICVTVHTLKSNKNKALLTF